MSLGRQGLDPRQGVPPPGGHGRSETPLWCSVLTAPPAAQHTCLYLPTWDRPYPPPGAGPPPARAALRACPAPALPRERPTHPPWQRVRVQMATLTFHKQALAQVAHSPAEPDTRGLTPQEGPCQSLGPGDQGCSDQARPCQRSRPGFHLLLSAAFTALPPTSMELAFSPQLDPRACTGLVPMGKCSSEFTRNQTAGQADRGLRIAGRRASRHGCSSVGPHERASSRTVSTTASRRATRATSSAQRRRWGSKHLQRGGDSLASALHHPQA